MLLLAIYLVTLADQVHKTSSKGKKQQLKRANINKG